jgi:uncharacterized protein (DUF2267 family)
MDCDDFVATVQEFLGIERSRAEQATQATLRTLADRMSVRR